MTEAAQFFHDTVAEALKSYPDAVSDSAEKDTLNVASVFLGALTIKSESDAKKFFRGYMESARKSGIKFPEQNARVTLGALLAPMVESEVFNMWSKACGLFHPTTGPIPYSIEAVVLGGMLHQKYTHIEA